MPDEKKMWGTATVRGWGINGEEVLEHIALDGHTASETWKLVLAATARPNQDEFVHLTIVVTLG